MADPSKLHFGCDYPFTPTQGCEILMQQRAAEIRAQTLLRRPKSCDERDFHRQIFGNAVRCRPVAGAHCLGEVID